MTVSRVRADRLGAMGSWMGARIALFYATLRPETKALVQLYGAGAGSINPLPGCGSCHVDRTKLFRRSR